MIDLEWIFQMRNVVMNYNWSRMIFDMIKLYGRDSEYYYPGGFISRSIFYITQGIR